MEKLPNEIFIGIILNKRRKRSKNLWEFDISVFAVLVILRVEVMQMEILMSLETISNTLAGRGGQMSEAQTDFCRRLRNRLHEVLEGRHDFRSTVVDLFSDLQSIRGNDPNLTTALTYMDGAFRSGWEPRIGSISPPVHLGNQPLSESERAFVNDMDGLLDYAMRNGMNFMPVFGMISHDIYEIGANRFRLEGAPFTPQVSGYAQINTEVCGASEE